MNKLLIWNRLSLDHGEIQELVDCVSEMKDVKCVCFKNESLHLSRNIIDDESV